MDSRNSNLPAVRSFFELLSDNSVVENPYPWEPVPSCTIPNASLSPRDIFKMYSRGIPVPPLPLPPHEDNLVDGQVFPDDPSQVRQMAADALQSEYQNWSAEQAAAAAAAAEQAAANADVSSSE